MIRSSLADLSLTLIKASYGVTCDPLVIGGYNGVSQTRRLSHDYYY